MKRIFQLVILLMIEAKAFAAPMDAAILSVVRGAGLKNADVGVYAVAMPKNRVLADINKDMMLNPASCMKLVTTAVALKMLGPDYRFPTQFYLMPAAGGGDAADLWVKGYGDPSLVIERLEEMVNNLIKAGLPAAVGDIFIDDSYFESGGFPGRQKGSSRSYNAMTSAVALNHGALTVEVLPGGSVGAPAEVVVDAPGVSVENHASTAPARSKGTIHISRIYTRKGDVVRVAGRIPKGSPGKKKYFSVTNPAGHFADALKTMLAGRGVGVNGGVRHGIVPKTARMILEEKSPPLSEITANMNKNSSNFIAEQLTKVIGEKTTHRPGSTQDGVSVYAKYLSSLGMSGFYVENGSGLSYNNRLSPHHVFTVMKDMYDNKRLREVYIDSLSAAGGEGTLKKWGGQALSGKVKAKTGTLSGVSTLAGFLLKDGETILFVIFLNGGHIDFYKGRQVSQRIVEVLAGI